MARYGGSVARALDHALLVVDIPFMSYNISVENTSKMQLACSKVVLKQ